VKCVSDELSAFTVRLAEGTSRVTADEIDFVLLEALLLDGRVGVLEKSFLL